MVDEGGAVRNERAIVVGGWAGLVGGWAGWWVAGRVWLEVKAAPAGDRQLSWEMGALSGVGERLWLVAEALWLVGGPAWVVIEALWVEDGWSG